MSDFVRDCFMWWAIFSVFIYVHNLISRKLARRWRGR